MKKIIFGLMFLISCNFCLANAREFQNFREMAPIVSWGEYDTSYEIRGHMGLEFFYEYEVVSYSQRPVLYMRVCENNLPCDFHLMESASGTYGVHYAIDPTQYHWGSNHYTLTLILSDGDQLSESSLNIEVFVLPF